MKKLALSIALFSFVGLTTISASPCDDDKKCTKKECTKAEKKECAKKGAKKSCCASKASAKKSCHGAKAKATETKEEK